MFLFAALAIWAIFEQYVFECIIVLLFIVNSVTIYRDLLETREVPDFYSKMAELGEKLKNTQLLSSTNFIQVNVIIS